MGIWDRLFGQHEIDGWRDDWTLVAAGTLNNIAHALGPEIDRAVAGATRRDLFLSPGSFLTATVAPMVREASGAAVEKIVDEANQALRRLVDYQAAWNRRLDRHDHAPAPWEGTGDLAMAAAPLAGGVAIAAATVATGVTTTTAWFGLVTATAISWPVVVIGSAAAGTAVLTGAVNAARLTDRFRARLRTKAQALTVAMLIRGAPGKPAVLEQLAGLFAATADEAKRR